MPRFLVALMAAALIASAAPAAAQTATHTSFDHTVTSSADGTPIQITVFRPAAADSADVPVVLSSHGWGGSRWGSISQAQSFLDAGFGVVSIDQRGHGASGGEANVQDPDLEAEDIQSVVDYIAGLDWVRHDTDESGAPIANDPVLAAVGGSYGGGYQTITALDEIAEEGNTRFNALAPEITWYDLPQSLAPNDVPRTVWTAALYAAGASMLPQYVHVANAYGVATGQWPDGTMYGQPAPGIVPDLDAEFHEHSPAAFVERGVQIDVPVLVRQGATDTLFNLNEGLNIFNKAVTDEARQQSYFIGYNGGHVLPNAFPSSVGAAGDACSPDGFTNLTIEFFKRVFAGESTDGLMDARYNLTAADGDTCLRMDSMEEEVIGVDPLGTGSIATSGGAGAPLHFEIAQGPLTVSGVPSISGTATALGLDSRAFLGLSVGTSPADARVIDNQLTPLRVLRQSVDTPFEIDLAGIAAELEEGESLFLTVAPITDMFAGTGSRTSAGLVLSDVELSLPAPGELVEGLVQTVMNLTVQGKGSKAQLVATLTEAGAGTPVQGVAIDFAGDGKSLGTATTGTDGTARLPLAGPYRGGNHAFDAVFAGTPTHAGSSASTSN
jgi:pimeloyl-ACP methyl ester carboxylesterase